MDLQVFRPDLNKQMSHLLLFYLIDLFELILMKIILIKCSLEITRKEMEISSEMLQIITINKQKTHFY